MHDLNEALVRQQLVEARQKAADDRRARLARRESGRRSLLERIRGIR